MQLPDLKEARKRTNNEVLTKRFSFNDAYKSILTGKSYHLKTFGCQMNERDSENIKAILELMGAKEIEEYQKADIILINTCSIRENAHNKVFGLIGRIRKIKEKNKDLIVGITGCMAQEEIVIKKILSKHKHIDFVLGTHKYDELQEMIYKSLNKKELKINATSCEGDILEDLPTIRTNKYKAFVNIMLGCDKFCTYCIVPYTRGKQRSRSKEDIINEINDLIKKGYQEVTLLGQNVNAYGKDLANNYNLANLLQDISKTKIKRIRFMTSHPWDFTDEMINIIANNENIMPHIHLPVQSGNNDILKLMGRRYTKEDYLILINKIKNKIPNISITTDIIVGFPNETKKEFKDTLDLIDKCKFDMAYTFIFSKRVGTPAYNMEDKIELNEKEERLQTLNTKIKEHAKLNNEKYLNQIVPVLCEDKSDKENMLMGYTDTNKLVNFKGNNNIGQIVNVKITSIKTWSLDGEVVE